MNLNVNSLLCHQCYAYYDQTAEAAELLGFRYKVALYLSYQQIKFDGKIQRANLRILSINSDEPVIFRQCIVTKELQIRSRGFHCRAAKGLNC